MNSQVWINQEKAKAKDTASKESKEDTNETSEESDEFERVSGRSRGNDISGRFYDVNVEVENEPLMSIQTGDGEITIEFQSAGKVSLFDLIHSILPQRKKRSAPLPTREQLAAIADLALPADVEVFDWATALSLPPSMPSASVNTRNTFKPYNIPPSRLGPVPVPISFTPNIGRFALYTYICTNWMA